MRLQPIPPLLITLLVCSLLLLALSVECKATNQTQTISRPRAHSFFWWLTLGDGSKVTHTLDECVTACGAVKGPPNNPKQTFAYGSGFPATPFSRMDNIAALMAVPYTEERAILGGMRPAANRNEVRWVAGMRNNALIFPFQAKTFTFFGAGEPNFGANSNCADEWYLIMWGKNGGGTTYGIPGTWNDECAYRILTTGCLCQGMLDDTWSLSDPYSMSLSDSQSIAASVSVSFSTETSASRSLSASGSSSPSTSASRSATVPSLSQPFSVSESSAVSASMLSLSGSMSFSASLDLTRTLSASQSKSLTTFTRHPMVTPTAMATPSATGSGSFTRSLSTSFSFSTGSSTVSLSLSTSRSTSPRTVSLLPDVPRTTNTTSDSWSKSESHSPTLSSLLSVSHELPVARTPLIVEPQPLSTPMRNAQTAASIATPVVAAAGALLPAAADGLALHAQVFATSALCMIARSSAPSSTRDDRSPFAAIAFFWFSFDDEGVIYGNIVLALAVTIVHLLVVLLTQVLCLTTSGTAEGLNEEEEEMGRHGTTATAEPLPSHPSSSSPEMLSLRHNPNSHNSNGGGKQQSTNLFQIAAGTCRFPSISILVAEYLASGVLYSLILFSQRSSVSGSGLVALLVGVLFLSLLVVVVSAGLTWHVLLPRRLGPRWHNVETAKTKDCSSDASWWQRGGSILLPEYSYAPDGIVRRYSALFSSSTISYALGLHTVELLFFFLTTFLCVYSFAVPGTDCVGIAIALICLHLIAMLLYVWLRPRLFSFDNLFFYPLKHAILLSTVVLQWQRYEALRRAPHDDDVVGAYDIAIFAMTILQITTQVLRLLCCVYARWRLQVHVWSLVGPSSSLLPSSESEQSKDLMLMEEGGGPGVALQPRDEEVVPLTPIQASESPTVPPPNLPSFAPVRAESSPSRRDERSITSRNMDPNKAGSELPSDPFEELDSSPDDNVRPPPPRLASFQQPNSRENSSSNHSKARRLSKSKTSTVNHHNHMDHFNQSGAREPSSGSSLKHDFASPTALRDRNESSWSYSFGERSFLERQRHMAAMLGVDEEL